MRRENIASEIPSLESRVSWLEARVAYLEGQVSLLGGRRAEEPGNGSGGCAGPLLVAADKGGLDLSHPSVREFLAGMSLRIDPWRHHWECDGVGRCSTEFYGSGFVIDAHNGKLLCWNFVETAAADGPHIPLDAKPGLGQRNVAGSQQRVSLAGRA